MIIFPLCCFAAGYLICQWLMPGVESVYVVLWLGLNPLRIFIQTAFKQRDRFGFMRQWPKNTICGWGFFGERANNDGYIYFDWHLKQIIWRKPRTYWTRAMRGGIGLRPARMWFNIEADRAFNYSCFSFHIRFPFSSGWDRPLCWTYPGRVSIDFWPQNNEPEAAPC